MQNVLIAIPAFTWHVNVALVAFVCKLVSQAEEGARWKFHLALAPEVYPVQYARNMLVGDFLRQEQMDLLWFIDHDMIPGPETLRILEVDADVVSGRSLAAQQGPRGLEIVVTAFTHLDEQTGGFVRVQGEPTEPIPIIGAGAANLLIRRKVLQDPRMHLAPEYVDLAGRARSIREDGEAPAVFRMVHKPNGQVLLGEDIDFVHRATLSGYRCVYAPRSTMGHLKCMDLASIEFRQRSPSLTGTPHR